jgi:hypothetical protein
MPARAARAAWGIAILTSNSSAALKRTMIEVRRFVAAGGGSTDDTLDYLRSEYIP